MSSPALRADASQSSPTKAWLRALEMTAKIESEPGRTFPAVVEELGARFGNSSAVFSEKENFGHAQLAAQANRYARWAIARDIRKGNVVCLMMPNRAEYLAIWLGLTRIGGVVALINTNLAGPSLRHCIGVAGPSHILLAEECANDFDTAEIDTPATVWRHNEAFASTIAAFSGEPLGANEVRDVTLNDPALLIYTSGTTGLPKAAHVSHHRVMMWTHWFAGLMGVTQNDRLYNCLPMYHSVGGVVASGAVLLGGGSVVLREKFSASGFWNDVAQNGCTIFQYIGELCRYLLKSPAEPPAHRLRLCCGNGLSGEVWSAFQSRFAIPQILEFYAATEGNFSLYNVEGKPGAIGRVPPFLAQRVSIAIVKLDDNNTPVRDANGFCVPVARGDSGEAIGKIAGGAARFEGYTDAVANERKILRDVFKSGDAWLRTGDLMRQDAQGFFYFVDRLGDTFRWKGENVATAEVTAVLCGYPGIIAASVYGVSIPFSDGRGCMAALETGAAFDLNGLKGHLRARLPAYAAPVFLRLVQAIATTETFKQKKQELAREGFDPSAIRDVLYYDRGAGYERLDADIYARINSGRVRI